MPPSRDADALRTDNRRLRDELDRLRADEASCREIVNRVNSIVLRWDPEGRVIFLNDFGQRLFGYASEEVVGRSVLGLIVPDTESSGRDLIAMIHDLLRHPERYLCNENENVVVDRNGFGRFSSRSSAGPLAGGEGTSSVASPVAAKYLRSIPPRL